MSNLSDLLPAGAGGKQVDFVATGTLASGQAVVLKTDGTVSSITQGGASAGSPVVFESADGNYASATFDSNANKIVIAYTDGGNGNNGTAIVGTVSGTSISFGTPVVFESASTLWSSATFDSSASKTVIAYQDAGNSSYGTAIVGTVSGTSISFGTPVVFESANSSYISATFDSNANKTVIAYVDTGNGSKATAIVGTVSGTSISFGSPAIVKSAVTEATAATFDSSANKVVVAYTDYSNGYYGTASVGTVSGTSISFGTSVVFESGSSAAFGITFDSNANKVVMAYTDYANSSHGTAVVGTVSGTSISFGTPVVFESATTNFSSATFASNDNKVVIAYQDAGNSNYGTLIIGTVSGTSISFSAPLVFENAQTNFIATTFDSTANKVVVAYQDVGNANYGTSVVFETSSTTSADFIGITDAAISSAASGSVTIKGGISSNVSSLTPNATYYVQPDGTLTTTTSTVLAGRALSSTSINLDYTT
jgi:hypothetical protein